MGEESPFLAQQTMKVRTAEPGSEAAAALEARLGAAALARLLTQPRRRPTFALVATGANGPRGHALIAHERYGLGATSLDVGVLTLAADEPAAVEPLLAGAVAAAAEAELAFLTLRGAPQEFAAYGLAPCALVSEVRLPPDLDAAPALRPTTPSDEDDLAALANATLAGLPLAPRRAPPDWRWLLDAPARWLVLEDRRGRATAYARLAGDTVTEAAAADGGTARDLATALAAHGARTLALPLAHGIARAALLMGGTATVGAPSADAPAELWGVVDLVAALDALSDELARRAAHSRYAGWEGVVRLEGAAGSATLRCTGERVLVEEAAGPVDVMVGGLGLAAAAQLTLGYRQAADLRATGELRCADVDLGLLDALFPAL